MKQALTILILIFIWPTTHLLAQTTFNKKLVNNRSIKYAKAISKGEMVQSEAVGRGAVKPDQFEFFENLLKVSNEKELFELTNYPDPKVRCYAFWGLQEKKSNKLFEVLRKNENDTLKVEQQFGCIISETTVIDFMVRISKKGFKDGLSENDAKFLDQLLEARIKRRSRELYK